MSDKIARLGIERDNDKMYYIKNGDVWATPRKQPGKPKGKARKIAAAGVEMDYSKYIYFLDGDGDVARKARNSGGGKRAKAPKAPKAAKAPRAVPAPVKGTASSSGRGKTKAQLQREVDACLAKSAPAAAPVSGARKKKR
ncbi:MAG TPA: hypothetical protein VLE97_05200 [Gaiellaceae bacterium]|nr:hypothetical protein [Gaiellaceae bacterium]